MACPQMVEDATEFSELLKSFSGRQAQLGLQPQKAWTKLRRLLRRTSPLPHPLLERALERAAEKQRMAKKQQRLTHRKARA